MSRQSTFAIFSADQVDKIDFSEVLELEKQALRKSIDGSQTFVKWLGEIPPSVESLDNVDGPHTWDEMTAILQTAAWADPDPELPAETNRKGKRRRRRRRRRNDNRTRAN